MAYSDKFIDELIENMPQCIVSFFNNNQEVLELTDYTFHEYVAETLELRYKNYSRREMLAPVAVKVMRARVDKMNTLLDNYYKLLELKITNPKSALHYILLLPASERKKYDKLSYEEIVAEKRAESEAWRGNPSSYLTEFDGLSCMSKTLKNNSLRVDIAVFFWRYIEENYGGNISAGFVKRILVDYPIIAGISFKEVLEQNLEEPGLYNLKSYNPDNFSLSISNSNIDDYFLKDLRSLDPAAIMVLSSLIENIIDMEKFSKTRTVVVPISDIIKESFDYRKGVHYDKVKNIIRYMYMVSIKHNDKYNDGSKSSEEIEEIRIFSSIAFPKVGNNELVKVVFSEEITEEIVGNNVLSISKKLYKKLSNPNAKVICHAMRKEQIRANKEYVDRSIEYDYKDFADKIRFPSANKKDVASILRAAFDDFINQGIIVESYEEIGNHFLVRFLPYDEESED